MNVLSLQTQSQLLSQFIKDPNIIGVMLFGSQTSGKTDAFSDIDLYVLTLRAGRYTRLGFHLDTVLVDVLVDSLDKAKKYLRADRGAIRRPTSLMLANGKILFARTKNLAQLQRTAQENLKIKTLSKQSDFLMHAYSLEDFLTDLQRDAAKNDVLRFNLDSALFINNAIEFVLRKHGSYLRQTRETLEALTKYDSLFVKIIKQMSSAGSLQKRVLLAQKLRTHLYKHYECDLPDAWKI